MTGGATGIGAAIKKSLLDANAPEWYEGANESLRIALGQYIDLGV